MATRLLRPARQVLLLAAACALSLAACDDDKDPQVSTGPRACVEQPGAERPAGPNGSLPCDLLPPGFGAQR